MPDLNITSLLTNFAIASIFVWAWLQERAERREIQRTSQERIDALTLRTLELVRDITRAETMRDLKHDAPGLADWMRDIELARAMQAQKGNSREPVA